MSLTAIDVRTDVPYRVLVGPGALAELPAALASASASLVVSDETVAGLHRERLGAVWDARAVTVPPGEGSKSLRVLERVLDALVAADLDRRSVLVALGGGVVGDLGGLAAALYMRGIAWVQCPTTLLAQVDASVGGKTAVNLARGKNLAGSFHQPALVLADTETLATLPDAELRSGLGEVVKTALVGDAALLELLERDAERLRARDIDLYGEIVARCVRVKASIVARDERETGARKVLNLGHTFAHAIELTAGYGRIPHGVAVGVGVALALRASERTGLARPGVTDRIVRLLPRLGLGSSLAALREEYGHELPTAELLAGLRHDKKGSAGRPAFVLVRDVGAPEVDRALDPALLRELLA